MRAIPMEWQMPNPKAPFLSANAWPHIDSGDPKHVTNIDPNRTAVAFVPSKVVDRRFESSVEIDAN